MISRVLDDAVAQLDPTRLRRLAKAQKGGYEVREPTMPYFSGADGYAPASLRLADPIADYKVA